MRIAFPAAMLATAIASVLLTVPALAARDRVFVASYGDDANPCTYGSPCKTFQQAVNVVAPGGEVTAIDSAGFGPVTISQSVSITSPNGVEAGIAAAAGGTAITITGDSNVWLRGLTLEGANSAAYGIEAEAVGQLTIDNCIIRDYVGAGIVVSSIDTSQVTITNSRISHAQYGIYVSTPTNGTTYLTLDNVVVTSSTTGLAEGTTGASAYVSVSNSDFSHNTNAISVGGASGLPANLYLYNVVFNDNNEVVNISNYSNVLLSRVNDMESSSGLYFSGSTGIDAISDGTSHVALSGPNAPANLGSYTLR
jgi:hypothetical protein